MRKCYLLIFALLAVANLQAAPAGDGEQVPIRNYYVVSERLGTGGALSVGGVRWLANHDYQMIVDIRDEFDADEASEALMEGLTYIHLPVSWKSPSADELDAFLLTIAGNPEKKILIHCFANYRASAMTYLYRVLEQGADSDQAMIDVTAIWEPNHTWQDFFARSIDARKKTNE